MEYSYDGYDYRQNKSDFSDLIKLLSHDVTIWLALIFVAPVGIGLLWWAKKYTTRIRTIITIFFSASYISLFVVGVIQEAKVQKSSSKATPVIPVTKSTPKEKQKKVKKIKEVTMQKPTEKQIAAYRAFWGYYDKNKKAIAFSTPGGEAKLVRQIAKKLGMTVTEVDEALLTVRMFKEHITRDIRKNLVTVSRILKVYHTNQGVVIKLQARVGWSAKTMKATIQRDFLEAVGTAFSTSPEVARVLVWVVASMQGGSAHKVAQVDVTRQQYDILGPDFFKNMDAEQAHRLNPWYGPSLK